MLIERVVIDDERTHANGGMHLRTSDMALKFLAERPIIKELWLDHDLGGEDSIRPVVEYIERNVFNGTPLDIAVVYVHTANPVGADRIVKSNLMQHYVVRRVGLDCFLDRGH